MSVTASERQYFGKRLEPQGKQVLHGAGQSVPEFKAYYDLMGTNTPIIYMSYCGLKGDVDAYFARLEQQLAEYPDDYLIPQIGLSMTHDGVPEEHYEHQVAEGQYDEKIEMFCRGLRKLGRPAFVRIGYEFNGRWNGYQPESYVEAWRRVVTALNAHGLDDVATLWCYAADIRTKDTFMQYYPGDEWVDWWSIDLFDADHFTNEDTLLFMKNAEEHGFPVMIGESTPRRVGVLEGEVSWQRWFAKYFDFICDYPTVKGFCYISWEWSGYPQWSDWGDGRIGANAEVLARYRQEIAGAQYLHGGAAAQVRQSLGLA